MSASDADQVLIDAELRLNQARSDKRYDDADHYEKAIYAIRPDTWIGGAIKLRVLCDPIIGLESSQPTRAQMIAMRQLLDLAEASEKGGAA